MWYTHRYVSDGMLFREILSFVTTQMVLEGVMPGKISQGTKDKFCVI